MLKVLESASGRTARHFGALQKTSPLNWNVVGPHHVSVVQGYHGNRRMLLKEVSNEAKASIKLMKSRVNSGCHPQRSHTTFQSIVPTPELQIKTYDSVYLPHLAGLTDISASQSRVLILNGTGLNTMGS